jgi:predicted amidohydrolase YtcJ
MTADMIIAASTIITMDPALPRAEAVAVDSAAGTISAVGTLAEMQAEEKRSPTYALKYKGIGNLKFRRNGLTDWPKKEKWLIL